MEARSKDSPIHPAKSTAMPSDGGPLISDVVGNKGLSINPLSNYALPSSSASWSERAGGSNHGKGVAENIYQTSPTVFRASPPPHQKCSPRNTAIVDQIRPIVVAAVQDVMQNREKAGAHKGALKQRIAQTAAAQSETDRSLQALRARIEDLPARDLDVLQQGRKLAHALQQCDKECQVWKERSVEAENAANSYAAVAAAVKQEVQHKDTTLASEKAEASARMLEKAQEAAEAQNDARTLAKFCEDYMAKEEQLVRSLENARAETRAALTEVIIHSAFV